MAPRERVPFFFRGGAQTKARATHHRRATRDAIDRRHRDPARWRADRIGAVGHRIAHRQGRSRRDSDRCRQAEVGEDRHHRGGRQRHLERDERLVHGSLNVERATPFQPRSGVRQWLPATGRKRPASDFQAHSTHRILPRLAPPRGPLPLLEDQPARRAGRGRLLRL